MRIITETIRDYQRLGVTATAPPVPGLSVSPKSTTPAKSAATTAVAPAGPAGATATGTVTTGTAGVPVVSVLGQPGRVAGLPQQLPSGWIVRRPRSLDDIGPDDIVLISGATLPDVETARAALPWRTRIVALVDESASPSLVADVLTAGADGCVRDGRTAVLASHLVGCRRRQVADRWAASTVPAG